MVKIDINKAANSSESDDHEESKARQPDGVNSDSLAADGDTSRRDEGDGDNDSDILWEDVSDIDIDANPEELVEFLREELEITAEDDPAWQELLNSLGHVLFDRYSRTGAIADLNEAIQIARQVLKTIPDDDSERPGSLNNLGIRLGERYSRCGATADFEEAKEIMRTVADLPLSSDLEPAGVLHNLGMLLGHKYSRTGALADLEEAIQITRRAVDATPEDHPDWAARINNLGIRLRERSSGTGDVRDLEEALQLTQKALVTAPEDHPDYPGLVTNLGALLSDQYATTGSTADLREAIRYMRQAVNVTPSNHRRQAMLLSNLGLHLGEQHKTTGVICDLEEAIQVLRQAVRITSGDDPDRDQAVSLNNLGLRLGELYLSTGAMADLDEAIQYTQQAVEKTQEGDPHWAVYINNLGAQLNDRYLRIGAIADLEEAIRLLRQAIDATPESHPNSAALLTNLAIQLGSLYSRSKAKVDLDEAIQTARRGLESTPENHPNRIVQLDILAILLGHKYRETRAMADLEEAIRVARQAVDVTPQGHQYRAGVLNNLGDELGNLYLNTKDTAHLEEAIMYLRQAVEVVPRDYPDRSALLGNLGDQLNSRYTKTGAAKDREDAITYYQEALNQTNSYTLSRIWAGRAILRCEPDWQQAYAAASLTVGLVPRLSSRSLQNSDRQHVLSQVVGFASDAAAIALQTGQTPLVALGLLEQGRGVLGASLEEVRTDILSLRERERKLADEFVRLRDELETAATQSPRLVGGNFETPWQARASRRYEAGKEFDELVAKIQKLPGFEDFLLPPSETEIKAAARCGPIVIINISKYRCDALLVESHQIHTLALSQLSMGEVEDKAWGNDLGSPEVLEWLWDKVARPILDTLGFTHPRSSSDDGWPHVWWIPTGPLSKFPIHAAGYHSARSTDTVIDRVMSSYASSVKAIVHGRRRRLQPTTSTQALLVAMEHTPGNDMLLYATQEVAMVRTLCESMPLQPVEPGRRKQDVELHLQDCRIFHFAGHGATDEYDAANSRLILEDGVLRVAELLEMNLVERSPFLAYLSACGTGRIRDEKSVDESIHLMSAFQLAGFRHVVGTLWEVRDELCVDMARITYDGMRDGGMTDESVCRGLHHAARTLRDQCLDMQSETEDESWPREGTVPGSNSSEEPKRASSWRDVGLFDVGPAPWAPYVHFGV